MHRFTTTFAVLFPVFIFSAWTTRAADLADNMPDGTLLYIGWPGIDRLSETAKDTSFAKLMNEPELQRLRKACSDKIWPAVVKEIKKSEKDIGGLGREINESPETVMPFLILSALTIRGAETLDGASSLLGSLRKYPAAFAVCGVSMSPAGPQVDAALMVRAGKQSPDLVQQVDHLLEVVSKRGPHIEISEVEIGGIKWKEIATGQPAFAVRYGVRGDDFIVAVGRKICERADASGPGLGKSARYAAAMKTTGGSADTLCFYLDLAGVVKTLEEYRPMMAGTPVLGDEGGVKKVLEALGLGGLESFSMDMVPEANGFKTTAYLRSPGMGKGMSKLLLQKPLTDNDLKVLPRDAAWATVTKFDLVGLYNSILESLEKLSPQTHTQVTQAIAAGEGMLNVKIRDDILGTFGGTWAFFDAPSNGTLLLTGITMVADVKPGNKLTSVLQSAASLLGMFTKKDQSFAIQEEDHRGQKISYVNVKGLPVPIAPAWAEYQGKWIVALFPQMVRITLDRMMDKSESLLANPDFQRARKLMPANASSITYSDSVAGLRMLYSIALPAAQALIAMGQGEGMPLDPSLLPAWPTLARHLYGDISATAETEDGIISVSHGALPLGLGGFGLFSAGGGSVASSAMMVSILLPSLARARELSKRTVSHANLIGIGTAMYTYANENNDQFPPSFQTLVDNGSISPKTLISPRDNSDATCSYVYIPGQSTDSNPRNVIAYEKPDIGDGEGAVVLFADGHADWMSPEALEKALAETKKRMSEEKKVPGSK